jgi:hypothetical protein
MLQAMAKGATSEVPFTILTIPAETTSRRKRPEADRWTGQAPADIEGVALPKHAFRGADREHVVDPDAEQFLR